MVTKRYGERLARRNEAGLLRTPPIVEAREGKYIVIGGRRVLNFASNDYLGLGASAEVQQKAARNFQCYGTSSSSSRLVSGNYAVINQAEAAYARHFGYGAALFYPSGYQANLGVLSALFEKGDRLLFDKHVHASTVKGMMVSGATLQGYNHNSLHHLWQRLEKGRGAPMAVLTESLFSMDGDFLDGPGFGRLKQEFGFFSIVDEAHAFGAVGEQGRGLAGSLADVAVGTFGKAFGLFGAFVLLSEELREYLLNFSSPLIYSTTLPEAHAATALDILEIVAACDGQRAHLREVSRAMREGLATSGFAVRGAAHIIALEIGDERAAMDISRELLERDIFVLPVRYPTVPLGRAILRIGMTALHEDADVRRFIGALQDIRHLPHDEGREEEEG